MPLTTFTLFQYDGLRQQLWALAQMAPGRGPGGAEGLTFSRLLGSGGGNGFSVKPDFGTYAFLGQWRSVEAAESYFATPDDWWAEAGERSSHRITFFLEPTMTHGEWGGARPFTPRPENYAPADPVAVITRATIKTRKLAEFWRYVPQTSASIYDHSDRLLSIGVGEYPIFMQATFSLWKSGSAMQDYAYRSERHAEVVRLTRERGWYKEEMFTRFRLLGTQGSWRDLSIPEYSR